MVLTGVWNCEFVNLKICEFECMGYGFKVTADC